MEKKLKHLEFLQSAINRLANNSFLLKAWGVTLLIGIFTFTTKELNDRFSLIGFILIIFFWLLDGYFLWQERMFRALYDHVRKLDKEEIDFSMDTTAFYATVSSWIESIFSFSLLVFYVALLSIPLTIKFFWR